ncbi:hypothetical protein PR048_017070 [Dryococelus australis]|uniref:Uncharacterized protein n=1 Tax=Dryococelus australis TaxID=614101 RepID=A0ABQ9H8P8_9NEOP|nr:hypothetical protein PR048_017070 [Dryococelus australis]
MLRFANSLWEWGVKKCGLLGGRTSVFRENSYSDARLQYPTFTTTFSFDYRGHGGRVVNLLASHRGDPGSITGWVTPDFRMWESYRTMPLIGGFSRGSPVSPALSFRRCSILISITSRPQSSKPPAQPDGARRLAVYDVLNGVAPEWKGGGKREIPDKTRQPAALPGTIPTCKKSGIDPAGNITWFHLGRSSQSNRSATVARSSTGVTQDLAGGHSLLPCSFTVSCVRESVAAFSNTWGQKRVRAAPMGFGGVGLAAGFPLGEKGKVGRPTAVFLRPAKSATLRCVVDCPAAMETPRRLRSGRVRTINNIEAPRPSFPPLTRPTCSETIGYSRRSTQRYDGNTARLARRSDETLGVRTTVAHIAPSLLDLGRAAT